MHSSNVIVVALVLVAGIIFAEANPTTITPQPKFETAQSTNVYVPHATYPYADGYGPISPYEGYLYPYVNNLSQQSFLLSIVKEYLQVALRIFAKVGLFLMGGAALFIVGGLFTTAVCSLTPLCTITFAGFGGIDKDAVRSLMTPEKISSAAAIVQDAIGKYQRLQRAVHN